MSQQHLWAPWRMEYLDGPSKTGPDCIFCQFLSEAAEENDAKNLIVHRSTRVFVILNRFPYNAGHVMVVPNRHVARLDQLPSEEFVDIVEYTKRCVAALEAEYKAQGFNIGMNLGEAAGAGIKHHMHMHIVPRWNGDTNFMPVLAETKAIPQHLTVTREKLEKHFPKI